MSNKKISELVEYITPAEGDYLAVVDTTTHETKKIDFINFKGEKGDAGTDGTDGTDGASIITAEFSGDDILFTKDDDNTVTLEDAKTTLKGDTGESGLGAVIKLTTATAAATAAKTATLEGYTPTTGDVIALTLTSGNTAASMTLNINGAGAIAIHCGGLAPAALTCTVTAGGTIVLYYDGTVFVLTGATRDTNTTYTEISEADINAGTASTARAISGRRAKYIIDKAIGLVEGTAVKSTGEAGGTKFLREDGDGTCSWQTPAYPTRDSLGLDTDDSPQFAEIELGHASDTTMARVSAGVISVGGVVIPSISSVNTLTNKRITKRVASTTDDATAVIDSDSYDEYYLTAVASDTAISITGTPTNGQTIFIGLKDAGVTKGLTWTGITGLGVTLPAATTAGKQHIIGLKYIASAWRAIAVSVEA